MIWIVVGAVGALGVVKFGMTLVQIANEIGTGPVFLGDHPDNTPRRGTPLYGPDSRGIDEHAHTLGVGGTELPASAFHGEAE